MKKTVIWILAAVCAALLCACAPGSAVDQLFSETEGSPSAQAEGSPAEAVSPEQTASPTEAQPQTEETAMNGYHKISAEEAKQMIDEADRFVIVDVRTAEEFDQGHIPCAMLIPNEQITEQLAAEELPDKDVPLFVYCRSGRRSEEAARKLADMGYTNVYDFGGIIDWPYDVTTEADCPTA